MSEPLLQGLRARIEQSEAEVRRLSAMVAHPSARDAVGRARDDLRTAARLVWSDPDAETIERIDRAVGLSERRLKVVHDAVERFGSGAVLEATEHPSLVSKGPFDRVLRTVRRRLSRPRE